ncbi:D-alanyl-D-alanine carboxypeptidase/D-alanyl-D-alanine-endopeptidase [Candidatus Sumerlaeota bacterium]|nr:D-alanyl-D-alanine carboxypeptidase/D-alanyl-D-alanine-endopeptidase [Candidatus Sumerlaeota bacterium]
MKNWKKMGLIAISLMLCYCSRVQKAPVVEQEKAVSISGPEEQLKQKIMDILDSNETQNAFWGVLIKKQGSSEPFFALNENKSLMTASNMKLYSTAPSFVLLGKDFRYETPIYHTGTIDASGTLHGNVIIVGSGDPSISGRYREGFQTEQFLDEWAQAFQNKGVRVIEGDIIGDDDYFEDEEVEGSWQLDNLSYWYSAPSSALSINDNLYQFYMHPGNAPGETAQIESQLGTSYIQIQNDVITTSSKVRTYISYRRETEGNKLRVWGAIPLGASKERIRGCVYNATLFSAFLVKEALEKNGVIVKGGAVDIDDLRNEEKERLRENLSLVHTHVSPPLSEILRIVNKPSQNYYADMLLKTIGRRFRGRGSFGGGEEVVKDFLKLAGAPEVENFTMADGSGLSRRNLVQPRHTIALLEFMARQPDFKEFYDSLPIAGVDGTLRSRMAKPPLKGNVHAKTGHIGNVCALSGYWDDLNGQRWIFSFMCNHFTCWASRADALIDRALEVLGNYGE